MIKDIIILYTTKRKMLPIKLWHKFPYALEILFSSY